MQHIQPGAISHIKPIYLRFNYTQKRLWQIARVCALDVCWMRSGCALLCCTLPVACVPSSKTLGTRACPNRYAFGGDQRANAHAARARELCAITHHIPHGEARESSADGRLFNRCYVQNVCARFPCAFRARSAGVRLKQNYAVRHKLRAERPRALNIITNKEVLVLGL